MFRLINVGGRAALEIGDSYFDIGHLTADERWADPRYAIERHSELHNLSRGCAAQKPSGATIDVSLESPVPAPRQVFGIGLNYRDHASETGAELPPAPLTFTKFPTCIAGPNSEIPLSGTRVDWEVEIVVVIGAVTSHVTAEKAWGSIAGLTLGQDVSDRAVQRSGNPPQFSLGKSFANYGPVGPAVVSVDSFADPDDIGLWCDIGTERMQDARSSLLIFSIPTLVSYLSSICTLTPGDLIFSGTPAGVGIARGRFLQVGDVINSGAEVIGSLRNSCVAGRPPLIG